MITYARFPQKVNPVQGWRPAKFVSEAEALPTRNIVSSQPRHAVLLHFDLGVLEVLDVLEA